MDSRLQRIELPSNVVEGDSEGWLMSYLDVLTLLITLFVLLVAMSDINRDALLPLAEIDDSEVEVTEMAVETPVEVPVAARDIPDIDPLTPLVTLDENDMDVYQHLFEGIEIDGVSIEETAQSVTLRIDDHLLFDSGQASIIVAGERVLTQLAEALQRFDGQVSVEGHTDNVPIRTSRFPSNWELSSGRAISVVRHLSGEGVNPARLRAIGYADTRPIQSNESAAGRAANRRVELLITL